MENQTSKKCYGKCASCAWKYNGGCSEWNGIDMVKDKMVSLYARFNHPKSGYPCDNERAHSDGLIVGKRYAVERVSMGQYNTLVYLSGFGCYNSILFDFEDEDGTPHDIFRDKKYNPYISNR